MPGTPKIGRRPVAPADAPKAKPDAMQTAAAAAQKATDAWEPVYLEVLARHGNPTLAARRADVDTRTVKRRREADADFNAKVNEALDTYLDALEETLGGMNNPIARIARLRADRPARYLDKVQIAQAVAVTHLQPPDGFDVHALLRDMIADAAARPESRAALTGEIIDVTPAALTADAPPAD
jgi:hypothetical protein